MQYLFCSPTDGELPADLVTAVKYLISKVFILVTIMAGVAIFAVWSWVVLTDLYATAFAVCIVLLLPIIDFIKAIISCLSSAASTLKSKFKINWYA